jgi:hypothetical protein
LAIIRITTDSYDRISTICVHLSQLGGRVQAS